MVRTSIVIPVYNNLEMTRECLNSIRQYTEDYEIIVVDNGSSDGTVEYLAGQKDVKVIRNDRNLGFACAVNAGIRASSGEYVVVLNNDVLVTPRWLSNMVYCAESDPAIGLVGPVTGKCSGVQKVPAQFSDPGEMFAFAEKWNQPNPSRWFDTNRLVGFCMLVKREVFGRVGLFDERFGPGNFEDDDFCLRARLAGYRLIVAGDTYVHHIGSATFASSSIDYNALMNINRNKFIQKWQLGGIYSLFRSKHLSENINPARVPVPKLVVVGSVPAGLGNAVDFVSEKPVDGCWALHIDEEESIEGIDALKKALDGPRATRLVAVVYQTPIGEMVAFSPRLEYPGTAGAAVIPGVVVRTKKPPLKLGVGVPGWAANLERGVSWVFAGRLKRAKELFMSVMLANEPVAKIVAEFCIGKLAETGMLDSIANREMRGLKEQL